MTYTALITGNTSGIGKALAEKMAQEGLNLILVSRSLEKLEVQKQDLEETFNISVHTIAQDLSMPNAANTVFSILQKQDWRIDFLVNNAGFAEAGDFCQADMQKVEEMIHLHMLFTTQLTALLLPQMLQKRFGKILFLGSIASYMPTPYLAVYAACKAYVLSFSKALRYELKNTGVSITCLCPGPTQTEFAQKAAIEDSLIFKHLAMRPEHVASIGYNAMMRGKKSAIPGVLNKIMVASALLMPESIVNWVVGCMAKAK